MIAFTYQVWDFEKSRILNAYKDVDFRKEIMGDLINLIKKDYEKPRIIKNTSK